MRRHGAVIAISVLALSLFRGCAKDPFSTRPTEQPYGSTGTWETPQSPDVTLRNLLYAYNEMIISNYQLCFSDSFRFSSPEDSIDAVNNGHVDLFADWNRNVEIQTALNIFNTFSSSDTSSMFLTLAPAGQYTDIIDDTSAVMYRTYSLIFITTHPQSADTTKAEGLATFHLAQEQLNWWTINWWGDIPARTGLTDWGDIKAEYRSGF